MRRLVVVASLCSLFSCGNGADGNKTDSAAKDTTKNEIHTGSSWREITDSWNASLNLRNAPIMKSFYADSVLYYGDHLSSDEVVRRQEQYFAANKDYRQRIVEYIDEIQQPDGSWLIKIVKQVTANGKTNDYPASLVFAQVNGIWKIVAESDDITDLNKAKNVQLSYAPLKSTIEGLLEDNFTYGNVPGGDPKSDAKIPYYVVWSKYSLDIVATGEEQAKGLTTILGLDRIQLLGDEEQIRKLLNKKVRVTGNLSKGNPGEKQFTPVVMNVELIEEVL